MKWLVFMVAAFAAWPAGRWLRERPGWRALAWTLVGFLPFVAALDMALVSFGSRPGDTNGFEVSLVDWLVLASLFAVRGPSRPLPYRLALGAYLLVAVGSALQATWTVGALAYAWKLCRMYLLFAAIWRSGDDPRVPGALLRGLLLGLAWEGAWAAWQHYGLGLPRALGSFAHQNTLGMLVDLVVMVPLALLLAGPSSRLVKIAALAALPTCLFTVSRGTLLFLGAGGALVYLASSLRGWSLRKAGIGLVGLALAAALVPLALTMLESRSAEEQARSMRLRGQYEHAAALMLEEHPLGVGPNHFTVMLLTGGYGDRAGVDWTQRVAIVHSVYWLTAAEMGYPGVAALLLLFLSPLVSVVRAGLRAGPDRRGDVLVGLGAGLAVLYAHGFFEWVWRATAVSYVYWAFVGLAATLARQVQEATAARPEAVTGRWSPRARRAPRPVEGLAQARS